eukprot:7376061-Prymnesium_polylepis.2
MTGLTRERPMGSSPALKRLSSRGMVELPSRGPPRWVAVCFLARPNESVRTVARAAAVVASRAATAVVLIPRRATLVVRGSVDSTVSDFKLTGCKLRAMMLLVCVR